MYRIMLKIAYLLAILFLTVYLSASEYLRQSINVEVETDKQSYYVDEDIIITITAINDTDEPVTLIFPNTPAQVNYEIDDLFSFFGDWITIVLPALIVVTIDPCSTESWTYVHTSDHFFLPPGHYTITGSVYIYGSDETMISVTTTSNSDNDLLPPEDSGIQIRNYPNPFNPDTHISFQLPEEGRVSLTVFDARGRLVRTLADKSFPKGSHTVLWNGSDEQGREISSGVYYYRLIHQNEEITGKMLLLK